MNIEERNWKGGGGREEGRCKGKKLVKELLLKLVQQNVGAWGTHFSDILYP